MQGVGTLTFFTEALFTETKSWEHLACLLIRGWGEMLEFKRTLRSMLKKSRSSYFVIERCSRTSVGGKRLVTEECILVCYDPT